LEHREYLQKPLVHIVDGPVLSPDPSVAVQTDKAHGEPCFIS
jgi:hypothetical protein